MKERKKNKIKTTAEWHYEKDFYGEYIKVRKTTVNSSRELREGLIVDLDKDGNIVGVEII